MANKSDYEAAAKKLPSHRSVSEQALVSEGVRDGIGDTRNINTQAEDHERTHGAR